MRVSRFILLSCCVFLLRCAPGPEPSGTGASPEAVLSAVQENPVTVELLPSDIAPSPVPEAVSLPNPAESAAEETVNNVSEDFPEETAEEAEPAASAEPVQTSAREPLIRDSWYAERTEEMRKFMRMYGGYSSEEELESALSRMEIDPDRPMIALTFDDGPMAGITDEIVDILAENNARATFFIIGSRFAYDATPGLLQKILGRGNAIGNHMYNHDRMDKTDYKTLLRSAKRLNDAIYDATGYTCHLIRPPGGYGAYTAGKLGKRYDMSVILWAQSGNVHERDPEKINENVHRQIVNGKELQDGDIVLLHDTKPWMVEAVRIMVPQLIEEGYQLVTVPELLHLSDRGFVYGEIYKKKN